MPKKNYEKYKQQQAEISKQRSIEGRDIGSIPPVADPATRLKCERDLESFCRHYLADLFLLPWSADHRRAIARLQECIVSGGQFALAMPRGSGKTTLADAAVLWSVLYAHRKFVLFIGAEATSANERIDALKAQLESNDSLLADFPEVCVPIRALEGISHRCNGQLCDGERTKMEWTASAIVLPTVKGSKASGSVLRVAGITGRIRGMNVNKLRPDVVIIDDPQTRESAKSPDQVQDRLRIINGDVLGLAGPKKKIAAVTLCTVIYPGDVADQMLDREKNPVWQGERCKLLASMPKRMDLWEKYAAIRGNSYRAGNGGKESTAFYAANREAMDDGAIASWADRFNPDQASGVQFAMDLYFDAPESFAAEYQNDPRPIEASESQIKVPQVLGKLNGLARGVVPLASHKLTAFVDVQGSALFWVVCAWGDGFVGHVVDFGMFPEQGTAYYSLATAKKTLAHVSPIGAGQMGQVRHGLETLADLLLAKQWTREDGAVMKIDACGVDANWGPSTDTVYEWCRSRKDQMFMPTHGKYIGPTAKPIEDWERKDGRKLGNGWLVGKGKRASRYMMIDTNHWKTAARIGIQTPTGDAGALTIFGTRNDEVYVRVLADNLCSERFASVEGKGRKIDLWSQIPGRDNHLWDCLVGCYALASYVGVTAFERVKQVIKPKRRGGVSELAI